MIPTSPLQQVAKPAPVKTVDIIFRDMLMDVSLHGHDRVDRTGVGTRGLFGDQRRFQLAGTFPLLSLKKTHWKSVVAELLWFLRGETNNNLLRQYGVTIWDEWADKETGELGRIYGAQWRAWTNKIVDNKTLVGDGQTAPYATVIDSPIDQITSVIEGIRNNPFGRRHIVTAWNPAEVDAVALPPCHVLFQFYVTPDPITGKAKYLSCHLFQRSADLFLGVPFNIASYSLLTYIVGHYTGLIPLEFVHSFSDLHVYKNHDAQVTEVLKREPRQQPTLLLAIPAGVPFHALMPEMFTLVGYSPHPAIKADVAV